MLSKKGKALLEVNLSNFFISTSGVLGKSIELLPHFIIGLRCFFGALVLLVYAKSTNKSESIRWTSAKKRLIKIGLLLGLHWWLYFAALKLTSVSVAMFIMFTAPILTGFIEPFMTRTPFDRSQIAIGFVMLFGVYLMNPGLFADMDKFWGILVALISANFLVFRNIYSKKALSSPEIDSYALTFYQFLFAGLIFLPFGWIGFTDFPMDSLWKMAFLTIFTTVIGQFIFLNSLTVLSATVAGLMTSVQPLIGSFYAWYFIDEEVSPGTLLGGSVILLAAVVVNIRQIKEKN